MNDEYRNQCLKNEVNNEFWLVTSRTTFLEDKRSKRIEFERVVYFWLMICKKNLDIEEWKVKTGRKSQIINSFHFYISWKIQWSCILVSNFTYPIKVENFRI